MKSDTFLLKNAQLNFGVSRGLILNTPRPFINEVILCRVYLEGASYRVPYCCLHVLYIRIGSSCWALKTLSLSWNLAHSNEMIRPFIVHFEVVDVKVLRQKYSLLETLNLFLLNLVRFEGLASMSRLWNDPIPTWTGAVLKFFALEWRPNIAPEFGVVVVEELGQWSIFGTGEFMAKPSFASFWIHGTRWRCGGSTARQCLLSPRYIWD